MGFSGVANSQASGESAGVPPMPGPGYFGLRADPNFLNSFTNSALIGKNIDKDGNLTEVHSCKSFDDLVCANSNFWQAKSLYTFCETDSQTDCIEEVTARSESDSKLEVILGDKFPGVRRQDFVGSPSRGLATGGQTRLVRIPGAPHASGDLYLAVVNPTSTLNEMGFKGANFTTQFQASLYAVKINQGQFNAPFEADEISQYPAGTAYWGSGSGSDAGNGCILNDAFVCAVPEEMPLNVKFGMKIRTSYQLTNWFSGRLSDSSFVVSPGINRGSVITVEANPVMVPKISKWFKKTNLPKSLWDWYSNLAKPWGGSGDHGASQNGPDETWSLMRDITGYNQFYMDEFLAWLPVLGDKADFSPTLWSIRGMQGTGSYGQCASSTSVAGVVSTNATQYLDGPPTFDRSTQELNYKVASTHYLSDGSINKGTYDLVIDSKVARCIYGFSNAPINAKIEITSSDGQNQIAVTNVSERDGWIHLVARGFTFSNPTLKVKLSQEKTEVKPKPSPSATPSTTASTLKLKVSITCIKGKMTKKVTAVNPKCPTGYKKKAA
jgi:hypothetical protein